ncbi:hypothetical protein ACVIGA_005511 [Bradyrhizobium sp. USDA 3240]
MSLQFLDDLTQPFALASLGKQNRFQRLGIVRQGVAHTQFRAYSPPSDDAFDAPDSLRRSAANNIRLALAPASLAPHAQAASRAPPAAPTIAPPTGASRRPRSSASGRSHPRASWRTGTDPFRPEHQLDTIRPLGPKHIDSSRELVCPHALAHQDREPFHPLAEVHRFGRHHHPDRTRRADHRLAFSAWTIDAIIVVSAPRPARIVMPSTSISMIPASQRRARVSALALQRTALRSRSTAGAGTAASTTAGTNLLLLFRNDSLLLLATDVASQTTAAVTIHAVGPPNRPSRRSPRSPQRSAPCPHRSTSAGGRLR